MSTASSCRRRSISGPSSPTSCARRCRFCSSPRRVSPDFADQIDDILAMLHGRYRVNDYDLHAVPGERTTLTPWVFGSSKGQSAQVAGANGLPFVASYHITPATALDAVDAYRAAFTPSAALPEPYVVVSADVVVADDTETAKHLASTYGHWVYSVRKGGGAAPYPDPDTSEPLTEEQLARGKGPHRNAIRRRRRHRRREAGNAAARDGRRRTGCHVRRASALRPVAQP